MDFKNCSFTSVLYTINKKPQKPPIYTETLIEKQELKNEIQILLLRNKLVIESKLRLIKSREKNEEYWLEENEH